MRSSRRTHAASSKHQDMRQWAHREGLNQLVSCAIVELGFIRVSSRVYGASMPEAEKSLANLKKKLGGFIGHAPSPKMPTWVNKADATTDAYLLQLAVSAGLKLATFDTGIPGAVLIK